MVKKNRFRMFSYLLTLTIVLSVVLLPMSAIALEKTETASESVGSLDEENTEEDDDAPKEDDDETKDPAGSTDEQKQPTEENPFPVKVVNMPENFGGAESEIPSDLGGMGGGNYDGAGGGMDISGLGGMGAETPQGEQSGSVPRVIVTGFSTDPGEVMAGTNFNLVIHLRNTSKTMKVKNMLFTLTTPEAGEDAEATAPVFLPSSGSNSIYLESIKANGYADISIYLNAKADLLQKPYSMNLTMVYEDENANQFESMTSISVPVKQPVRFEIGELEISPQEIEVGSDSNVMCNIYNMGRVKLYNVKATFSGDSIEGTEVFLGNIMPGATAAIDTMITGISPTAGTAVGKMKVTYEDEAGLPSEMEKEFHITVMEPFQEEMMMEEFVEQGPSVMNFIIPAIIALIIIAIIVTIVVTRKKKRRRRARNAEESLINEVDRPLLDE